MQKRWFTLVNGQSLSDSQTFTQSLIGVGKIYSMRVNYQNTNGATSNTVGNLHSMVSKLQILDGSRVLHSLSMPEEIALNAYRRGKMPSANLTLDAAGVIDEDCTIQFWLDEDDDQHYLDTNNYQSPAIAFTHAFTISATAGFATGQGLLTVEALLGDSGAPASTGFLLAKEFASFTPAASGILPQLLALDLPYVALMTLTGVSGKNPLTAISNLELQIDSGLAILYNRATLSIAKDLRSHYVPFNQDFRPIVGGTADTIKTDLYDLVSAYVGPAGATAKSVLTVAAINVLTTAKTTGETGYQQINAQGFLPMGALYLPFGTGMDANDFLNPTGFKKLELDMTQGEADSTQVVTLQMATR